MHSMHIATSKAENSTKGSSSKLMYVQNFFWHSLRQFRRHCVTFCQRLRKSLRKSRLNFFIGIRPLQVGVSLLTPF
jgi:hypothetical protein